MGVRTAKGRARGALLRLIGSGREEGERGFTSFGPILPEPQPPPVLHPQGYVKEPVGQHFRSELGASLPWRAQEAPRRQDAAPLPLPGLKALGSLVSTEIELAEQRRGLPLPNTRALGLGEEAPLTALFHRASVCRCSAVGCPGGRLPMPQAEDPPPEAFNRWLCRQQELPWEAPPPPHGEGCAREGEGRWAPFLSRDSEPRGAVSPQHSGTAQQSDDTSPSEM